MEGSGPRPSVPDLICEQVPVVHDFTRSGALFLSLSSTPSRSTLVFSLRKSFQKSHHCMSLSTPHPPDAGSYIKRSLELVELLSSLKPVWLWYTVSPGRTHGKCTSAHACSAIPSDRRSETDRRRSRRPRGRYGAQKRARCHGLAAGEIPGQHVLFSACDEHAKVTLKIDSVDMDDAVHLIHHIGHGATSSRTPRCGVNVRPPPGIERCTSLDRSHPMNALKSASSEP